MAATNTMSNTAPVQRGVMGAMRERPTSSGLAAKTTSTPRGKRISRGKSTAFTPSATHTRKMAPPNTVPKATGAEPLAPAASPTATFSTSKPDRTAPTAKAESRSATDKPTNPSKSRSVAQTASKTPITNRAMPTNADIDSPVGRALFATRTLVPDHETHLAEWRWCAHCIPCHLVRTSDGCCQWLQRVGVYQSLTKCTFDNC